ncbi:MAG: shikimate dehydrogenase [Bacteroidota bacterium]|nr:shikimate dehydrogenase [Bacteroidota bacterium]MDE2833297.1 shikimate dehydrogenase [Bacteroidota bacterium]MDE2956595.1 shikimate dehydrogenase [Bacteroidota bacterium]
MMIDAETRMVAILGCPVRHSLSPLIHNLSFRHQGLNLRYVALKVAPADLRAAVRGLPAMGFLGANVTIPHKAAVLELMDSLSKAAGAARAVNTIVCRSGNLFGDNTDIAGFLSPLSEYRLHGTRMVILGAGGAARAAAYGLLMSHAPDELYLAARRITQAEALAADLAAHDRTGALACVPINEAGGYVRSARLIVNTTPVGMDPRHDATPWHATDDFNSDQVVYDLVYRPLETRLLREARQAGATVIGGLEMFVQQAAAAYVQWTNRTMDVVAVRAALADTLC